jgi:hypothetical protein
MAVADNSDVAGLRQVNLGIMKHFAELGGDAEESGNAFSE